jgi:uncharacterized protein (TIGR02231 family)
VTATAGGGKEAVVRTSVVSATVYRGQAQVSRSGSLSMKRGQIRIFCDDLPAGFVHSSLQVEGHGTADVTIVGTDIIRVQEDPAASPKHIELTKKLETLEARRDSIGIVINALQIRLQFVEQLGRLPMQQNQAEEFPSEIFQVDGWKALMDFLQSERTGADAEIYSLNTRKKKIEGDIEWIRRQLGLLRSGAGQGYRVAIDCSVESAGDLSLEISYIVPGTSWVPEYRVSFDPAKKEVGLTYNARIKQSTGEDWNGVDLTLSTAMPHAGAAPPDLEPYYLSRIVTLGRMQSLRVDDKAATVMKSDAAPELEEIKVGGGRSAHAEARVETSEFAASFTVPSKIDLATGADSKRVRIMEGSMPAELSLYTAPRLRGDVFVRGTVTNSLGAPLLPGSAEVYIDSRGTGGRRGSTFVGRQQMETFAEGQEFPLHLGVDQDVKVEHKLEKREYVEKEGKKWKKIRYHYLITLENFKKEEASVELQDRIPVSTMKEVKVEDVDISTEPDEEGDDGILTWNLSPAAGEKIEIRLAYTIVFPGDWPEHMLNLE